MHPAWSARSSTHRLQGVAAFRTTYIMVPRFAPVLASNNVLYEARKDAIEYSHPPQVRAHRRGVNVSQ